MQMRKLTRAQKEIISASRPELDPEDYWLLSERPNTLTIKRKADGQIDIVEKVVVKRGR